MSNRRLNIWLWILGGLSFAFLLFAFFAPYTFLQPNVIPDVDFSEGGELGKTIGGLMAPFIAIAAALLTFIAFLVQYQANLRIQTQFRIQQVSNNFFEMLRLHKENINEMNIVGYDYIEQKLQPKPIQNPLVRNTSGRKVFVTMNKELEAAFFICKYYLANRPSTKIDEDNLANLSYEIFFYGINSDAINQRTIDDTSFKGLKEKFKEIRNKHANTFSKSNVHSFGGGKKITLYFKYKPFSGHESRLGHYFRHLYSTVSYVVEKEQERIISAEECREFLKLLRAQMSNDEQLMLYYNYRIGFGENWDKLGNRGNRYLTDYRMLHNIPLHRVSITEKAEDHFSEYVKENGDSVFEQLEEK